MSWSNNSRNKYNPLRRDLKKQTTQSLKYFFFEYILHWLENIQTPPEMAHYPTESGQQVCYILCQLPYDCLAVYANGKILVAEGFFGDGSLKPLKGVEYQEKDDSSVLLGQSRTLKESVFVKRVGEFVSVVHPK